MEIPLNQFEQYIDEKILQRGLSYFNDGRVHELEEIIPGDFETIVEGTEDYFVNLTIDNGIISDYFCDCPYDLGPVCKHIAAVIFHIQQDDLELDIIAQKTKNNKTRKTAKRKTVAQKVEELLEKITVEELKQFIRDEANTNRVFRNLFLSSFAQHNPDESKELYKNQIQSILSTFSDSYGFIDWSTSSLVGNAVESLLESAQKQIDNHNYKSAVFICTAVMEELTDVLQFSDDSDGEISGCIYSAEDMLINTALLQNSEEIRKHIIEYCFEAYDENIYSDWDWHIGVLRIASHLLKTEEEIERIFKLIEKPQRSEYYKEEAKHIKYEILLKTKSEKEAEKYLEQNITNPKLRREAIQRELERKNYKKAKSIAKDGVDYDLKDKPGLATEWYNWLLKIAQAQNDSENVIEYAKYLLIDNFSHEQDYYKILKQNVEPEEWKTFIEKVIQEIETQKSWHKTNLIARIFIKEEWWDRLLDLVKESQNLQEIEHYEEYLAKNYSNEVAELYIDGIKDYMEKNMGRNHYQKVCRYLRRIIKLGCRDKANETISYLRSKYPKRRALMDELNKFGSNQTSKNSKPSLRIFY